MQGITYTITKNIPMVQVKLNGKALTERDRLLAKRMILYEDMVEKLQRFAQYKKDVISKFNASVKQIDKQLARIK